MRDTQSVRVDRPPHEVWKLVGNVGNWPLWAAEVEDVQVAGRLEPGATVSYAWRAHPTTVTITSYEQDRLLAVHGDARSYGFDETIELAPTAGDGTEVTVTFAFEPTAWWARAVAVPLAPLKPLIIGREVKRTLVALRDAAERSAPGV